MKQFIILILLCSCFSTKINAQEKTCEVALEAIKGTYTGSCENNKANGHGKAVGTDVYEGNFKEGYPDGRGLYTWKNESYYNGNFKKGRMDGEGEMHFKTASGQDSVQRGFWKKDKYLGRFEKAFIVKSFTTRITKVDCRMISKKGRTISVTTHMTMGSGAGVQAPVITITNISVVSGTYFAKYDQNLSNGSTSRLQEVVFPFRAIFFLSSGDQTEIIFNEEADYDVILDIL